MVGFAVRKCEHIKIVSITAFHRRFQVEIFKHLESKSGLQANYITSDMKFIIQPGSEKSHIRFGNYSSCPYFGNTMLAE